MASAPSFMPFQDWVSTSHASENSHLGGHISVDTLLDREMKGYTDYLECIQSIAQKKLEDLGGNAKDPRDTHEESLATTIEEAGSRWKSFTELATQIRNRPYNFEPSDPVIPSFVEFGDRNCPELDSIPVYNRAIAYEAYARMIMAVAGVNARRICAAYEISREERTEADRRELFGLSRDLNTEALQKLNRLRDEMREFIFNTLEDTVLHQEIADTLAVMFHDNIRLIRCLIACEFDMSEEHEANFRGHMVKARKYPGGDVASLVLYKRTLQLTNSTDKANETGGANEANKSNESNDS